MSDSGIGSAMAVDAMQRRSSIREKKDLMLPPDELRYYKTDSVFSECLLKSEPRPVLHAVRQGKQHAGAGADGSEEHGDCVEEPEFMGHGGGPFLLSED
jgi:hypothetical protein